MKLKYWIVIILLLNVLNPLRLMRIDFLNKTEGAIHDQLSTKTDIHATLRENGFYNARSRAMDIKDADLEDRGKIIEILKKNFPLEEVKGQIVSEKKEKIFVYNEEKIFSPYTSFVLQWNENEKKISIIITSMDTSFESLCWILLLISVALKFSKVFKFGKGVDNELK